MAKPGGATAMDIAHKYCEVNKNRKKTWPNIVSRAEETELFKIYGDHTSSTSGALQDASCVDIWRRHLKTPLTVRRETDCGLSEKEEEETGEGKEG